MDILDTYRKKIGCEIFTYCLMGKLYSFTLFSNIMKRNCYYCNNLYDDCFFRSCSSKFTRCIKNSSCKKHEESGKFEPVVIQQNNSSRDLVNCNPFSCRIVFFESPFHRLVSEQFVLIIHF